MTREDIRNSIQEIFRDVLDNETLEINDRLSADTVDGWDSLAHISIITSVEKAYQIRFGFGELDSLQSVGDLLDMIEKKLNKKSG